MSWNEVALDESVEPEHPAPVLTLTQPVDDVATEEEPVLPLVLSGAALLVALVALGLVWRRRA